LKQSLRQGLAEAIGALTSASLIFFLCWIRSRRRARGVSLGVAYAVLTLVALILITVTGHLGGFLRGVETP
jgi:amino acid permease